MVVGTLALLILWFVTIHCEKRTYMTYDMSIICVQHSNFRIRMHHSGTGSTGLLLATGLLSPNQEEECVALVRPPTGYGVVFHVDDLRLRRQQPGGECRDYLKVHNETQPSNASAPLCGDCCQYAEEAGRCAPERCESEPDSCESFCGAAAEGGELAGPGALVVHYHTRCGSCPGDVGFQMVFTAYRLLPASEAPCVWPSDFECDNGRCIWSGLTCDGHNNCGDNSDELRAGNSHCAGEFPDPVKAAVVASAVIVTVLLGVVLAYFPRLRIRHWLRLSQEVAAKKEEPKRRPMRRSVSFQTPLPKIRELCETEV